MSKGITGLAHIGVKVADMNRSLNFYVNELGFELTNLYTRPNGTQLGFIQAGTCIIELICNPSADVSGLTAGRVDHICVECDDIPGFMKKLEGKVEVVVPMGEMSDIMGGVRNVFFTGPDGERIELFQFLSKKTSF